MKPVAHIPVQLREKIYCMDVYGADGLSRQRHKLACARKGDPPLFWWIAQIEAHTHVRVHTGPLSLAKAGRSHTLCHSLSDQAVQSFL